MGFIPSNELMIHATELLPQASKKDLLYSTLEKLPWGVVVEDSHREIIFINATAAEFLGLSREAVVDFLGPRDKFWSLLREALVNEDAFNLEDQNRLRGQYHDSNQEKNLELKNGSYLSVACTALSEDGGSCAWYFCDKTKEMRLEAKFRLLSPVDSVTVLPNRMQILRDLEMQTEIAKRYMRPLTIFLCEIDHFNAFVEQWGQDEGDIILRDVSRLITQTKRSADIVGRWDRAQFLVLLPETDITHAQQFAERLRSLIASHGFREDFVNATISGGLHELSETDSAEASLAAAQDWLYEAKSAGRDRAFSILSAQ